MNNEKPSLLIVDDEETIHRALARTFRREPFELLHAYDAAEAWKIVEEGPDIAAIICDHFMEGTNGLDLLKTVRAKRPSIVTVLLTGQADLDLVIDAINEGHVHRFFTKPWEPEALRHDVRQMIELGPDVACDTAGAVRTEEVLVEQLLPKRDDETGAFIIETPDTP